MKTMVTVARTVIGFVLLFLALPKVIASPPYAYERYYYTDATKTVECGGAIIFCDGGEHWGCYNSPYYTDYIIESCSSGGGGCPPAGECGDHGDNDFDGLIDYDDPGCSGCYDPWEFV